MIDAGADVGFVSPDGYTLLHLAVLRNNLFGTRIGISHGLQVGTLNIYGRNCLAIAETNVHGERCCKEIWDLLRNAGRRELSVCSLCEEGKAEVQFKPCLHRVCCMKCCIGWSKCVCGVKIEDKSDVMEDPRVFDEALKNEDGFIRDVVEIAGRKEEEIEILKGSQNSDRLVIARLEEEKSQIAEELQEPGKELKEKGDKIGILEEKVEKETQKSKEKEAFLNRAVEDLETENGVLMEDRICAVCLDSPKSYVFASCGHCACSECQKGLKT